MFNSILYFDFKDLVCLTKENYIIINAQTPPIAVKWYFWKGDGLDILSCAAALAQNLDKERLLIFPTVTHSVLSGFLLFCPCIERVFLF